MRFTLPTLTLLLLLSALPAAAVPVTDSLGGGFEYRRLELRFGDLRGEICNLRRTPVDEVAVLFTAEDFRDRPLWHTVVDLAGIGAGRCRSFLRSPDDFSQPSKLRGQLVTFHHQPLLPVGNLNLPYRFNGLTVRGGRLTSEFCNRSGRELSEYGLNLLALSGHGEVIWRENFPLRRLADGACTSLRTDLDSRRLARTILFNVLPQAPPAPLRSGDIVPGLSYDKLRVTGRRLRGRICNSGGTRGARLLKVYALRENGSEAWAQSLYLPPLKNGACLNIGEKILDQAIRPAAWRFRLADLLQE
ncbi:hypothetical protein C2E25_01300 [Geothermobacter hydrogeniphilus]|uniref:Uncharacterized protein n=1 Tax=Geothermobacter hydrogeniphilus TaxID=1969733 RepID=A0A2K2HE10_9BACT|nr:hypothetical protein [Geothermobacter hydrogeniphilus]PNU21527.1 hypothetical protein C2E25_01300 [Geothermobacter hydrogeniphilus]